MSAVQPKAPLTLEQAQSILETLTLLTTPTHQNSKLIFYDTKIDLEADSSTWRTLSSWKSSITGAVTYFSGVDVESASRDLTALPSLMERVGKVFEEQRIDPNNYFDIKQKLDLLEKVEKGLVLLEENRYLTKPEKKQIIETALETLRKTMRFYNDKSEASRQRRRGAIESKGRQELEQKDQEIARLKEEIAALNSQRAGEIWRMAKTTYELELAKKNEIIAAQALADPINLSAISTAVLLERIRVLLEVVNSRQLK